MILTNRDTELFKKIHGYGILTTRQIQLMAFSGVALTTVLRRLRKLEGANYIQRVRGLETFECAWAMTLKGAEVVSDKPPKRHFRRDVLEHELKLVELRLTLERHGIALSWIPEHEIRSKVAKSFGLKEMKHRIVPDGIMGVEMKGLKESVAIELELNFKNAGRYFKSFNDYRNKANIWGIWYVVATLGLGRQIEKMWCRFPRFESSPKMVWSVASEVLSDPLNARVFTRGASGYVRDLWSGKSNEKLKIVNTKPAQTPALEVSKDAGQNFEVNQDLTPETHTRILLPTG